MSETPIKFTEANIDKIRLLKEHDRDSFILATEANGMEYYNIRSWGLISKVYTVEHIGEGEYEPNWWEYGKDDYVNAILLVEVDTPAEYNQWVKDHPEYFI